MHQQSDTFFPPYLNAQTDKGERSRGPAVTFLQMLLTVLKGVGYYASAHPLEVNGIYDLNTENNIRDLQIRLTFPSQPLKDPNADWADGNFGPKTRLRLAQEIGFDVDGIRWHAFSGRTRWVNAEGKLQSWRPEEF